MALLEIDINITAFNTFVQVTPKKLIFIARVPQRLVLDQVLSNASFNSVLVFFLEEDTPRQNDEIQYRKNWFDFGEGEDGLNSELRKDD